MQSMPQDKGVGQGMRVLMVQFIKMVQSFPYTKGILAQRGIDYQRL